ncbi:MAG: twin-arginine translocase subunit TatC [Candidatus Limimorpha sp.]
MAKKDKAEASQDVEMSFGEHLEELRKVIVHMGVAFIVLFVILFAFFKGNILDIVFYPSKPDFVTNRLFAMIASAIGFEPFELNANPVQMYNVKMAGQFMLHIKTSAVGALVLAFPYIISQLWGFVKPALSKEVRKSCRRIVWRIVFWFFLGVSFSYFIIAPIGVSFLASYEANAAIDNIIDVASYVSTVTGVCLAGGLVFQLPLLVRLLASAGLVSSEWLRKNRKISAVVLLVLSAMITPPDVMSQLLIFVPFYLLYEYSISIAKKIEKMYGYE